MANEEERPMIGTWPTPERIGIILIFFGVFSFVLSVLIEPWISDKIILYAFLAFGAFITIAGVAYLRARLMKLSRFVGAGFLAAILLTIIAFTTWVIFAPQMGGIYSTEISMVLAIILGSAALLTVLTVVAVIFSALELEDKQQALGLPEGSVRAIIAICLIILFVLMSVYLFRSIGPITRRFSDATHWWNGSALIPVNGTIYVTLEPTEDQISIANNLVTTVGTLVVALAGFYFGTRAVTVARGGEDRTLTLVSPTNLVGPAKDTYQLSAGENELEIVLKPTPEDESITWETPPEGDKNGSLVQVEPNRFKYTPHKDFKGTAILRFRLSRFPEVKVELKVESKKPKQPSAGGQQLSTGGQPSDKETPKK